MKNQIKALSLLVAIGASAPLHAGDTANPPEKIAVCAACHGADGRSTQPIYPNLAGQYANYLEHALREYRDGSRKNAIMAAQAVNLSDRDIRELAEYFSLQPGPLFTPSIHASHDSK
jgi:cytochrome c553